MTSSDRLLPRLLFVDDEPDLLDSLADVWGLEFDVFLAASASDALAAIERVVPHVVISDMRMPGMDGATFLARVRERAPHAVRMLLTGHADLDAAIRAVNDGRVFRFLTKPCSHDVMSQALHDAVEQYRLQSQDRQLLATKLEQMSAQLVHAERLATLGTMSAALGHEMNNALVVLQSAVDAVEEAAQLGLPPDAETLQLLVSGKDRLIAQARGVLSISRASPRAVTAIEVEALVRQLTTMLGQLGIARRATISLTTDGRPVWVHADRTELEQVLINLVKNSIDAIAERKRAGRVDLAIAMTDTQVKIIVTDTGGGIPIDKLDRVFEPYFTTKAAGVGTGLGLPVVRQLVEGAGGTVAIASRPEDGTTVTVTLPRAARPIASTSFAPRDRRFTGSAA